MHIAIDPGHPSEPGDQGCMTFGFTEYEYVWDIAVRLSDNLGRNVGDIEVSILKESREEVVSLAERGQRSRDLGADLVCSIHVDSEITQNLRRAAGYYWPSNSVGAEICEAVIRSMPYPLNRKYGQGVFAARETERWLRNARAVLAPHRCTSVLVELGFASHPRDLAALLDERVQSGIVLALSLGVIRARQLTEGVTHGT